MNAPLFPNVVVNGESIPHSLIAAEAQNHPAPRGKPGFAWRNATNALVIRTLLLQEARRLNVAAAPKQVASGKTETKEDALIRVLLDQALTPAPPDEVEIRQAYRDNPERFRAPPLWEVSHILVACDPRDAQSAEVALRKIREIARNLAQDPAEFAHMARTQSDCGSAASGGTLGQIRPGDTVPEFEAALRDINPGEITQEPIQTRHGWHLIRMNAKAEGDVLPFDAVRNQIVDALSKRAWALVARDYLSELVAKAKITGATPAPGDAW